MAQRGDLVQVELDDELDRAEPRPPRRPWSLRTWSRAVLALALVGALGAATNAVQAAQVGGRYASTGFVTDLTVPRHALWSAEGVYPIGVVGDVLIAGAQSGEGVEAFQVEDGTPLWSRDGSYCTVVDVTGPSNGAVMPRVVEPDDGRVLCQSWGDVGSTAVRVIDPSDGTVLVDLAPEGSATQTWTQGAYLVVDESATVRTITVWSLRTGEELWHTAVDSHLVNAVVTADQVVLLDPAGSLAFDLGTGTPVEADPDPVSDVYAYPLADGSTVRSSYGATTGSPTVTVTGADGVVRWSVVGGWAPGVQMDDHRDDSVVVVADGLQSFRGVDAVTGEDLWTEQGWPELLIRARGALVISVSDVLSSGQPAFVVLDQRTGAVLWQWDASDPLAYYVRVSDGERLGVVSTVDGAATLVVRDLRTGAEVGSWDLPLDASSAVLALTSTLIVQAGERGMAVLGP